MVELPDTVKRTNAPVDFGHCERLRWFVVLAGDLTDRPRRPVHLTIPDLAGLWAFAHDGRRAREMMSAGSLSTSVSMSRSSGFIRELMGPAMKNALPHSHYPTKDGRWIAIACTTTKSLPVAELMGMPEVSGEGKWGRFQTRLRSCRSDAAVTHWTTSLDRDEALGKCEALGTMQFGLWYR